MPRISRKLVFLFLLSSSIAPIGDGFLQSALLDNASATGLIESGWTISKKDYSGNDLAFEYLIPPSSYNATTSAKGSTTSPRKTSVEYREKAKSMTYTAVIQEEDAEGPVSIATYYALYSKPESERLALLLEYTKKDCPKCNVSIDTTKKAIKFSNTPVASPIGGAYFHSVGYRYLSTPSPFSPQTPVLVDIDYSGYIPESSPAAFAVRVEADWININGYFKSYLKRYRNHLEITESGWQISQRDDAGKPLPFKYLIPPSHYDAKIAYVYGSNTAPRETTIQYDKTTESVNYAVSILEENSEGPVPIATYFGLYSMSQAARLNALLTYMKKESPTVNLSIDTNKRAVKLTFKRTSAGDLGYYHGVSYYYLTEASPYDTKIPRFVNITYFTTTKDPTPATITFLVEADWININGYFKSYLKLYKNVL